jgi:hypothetical protein
MKAEDLDVFFTDFAAPVKWGSVSGFGILDTPDEVVGDLSISTEYAITAKTAEFGAAAYNDAIQVDGGNFKVRKVQRLDDGKLCRITLTKV